MTQPGRQHLRAIDASFHYVKPDSPKGRGPVDAVFADGREAKISLGGGSGNHDGGYNVTDVRIDFKDGQKTRVAYNPYQKKVLAVDDKGQELPPDQQAKALKDVLAVLNDPNSVKFGNLAGSKEATRGSIKEFAEGIKEKLSALAAKPNDPVVANPTARSPESGKPQGLINRAP